MLFLTTYGGFPHQMFLERPFQVVRMWSDHARNRPEQNMLLTEIARGTLLPSSCALGLLTDERHRSGVMGLMGPWMTMKSEYQTEVFVLLPCDMPWKSKKGSRWWSKTCFRT